MTVGALLLAAGSASRFGSDKRYAMLPDGRTLLQACIDTVLGAGLPVLVCLGDGDSTLEEELQEKGLPVLRCAGSAEGMGRTLAQGMGAVPADWRGVLVVLGDMPWVTPATLRAVAGALDATRIAVPCEGGRRGNPVGFGRDFFGELAGCGGDRGARVLLRSHAGAVVEVPVADAGIHRDVDTPAMLRGGRD